MLLRLILSENIISIDLCYERVFALFRMILINVMFFTLELSEKIQINPVKSRVL
ncbi:hypothetical protein STRIC_2091 [Streptococcus ictaluri 707-05]|uniref:Uncharacterized protein n=1 Tax=Streptococcus ictaluri 707-05 TaxID=764299 RepID=G5K5H6_9STRE|nr:hypothetical protein STRIC_2091 [Streptococcus ictaluri 707-05]